MQDDLSQVMANALAGDPQEIAIEYGEERVRWEALARVSRQLEDLLVAAQVAACVPVGFIPQNNPTSAAALLSLLAGRRSITMIYSFQSRAAIAANISQLQLAAYIAQIDSWTPELLAALPPGAIAIGLADHIAEATAVRLTGGLLHADRRATRDATDEPVIEMLTSGTTGAPKRHVTRFATVYEAIIRGNMMDISTPGKPVLTPGIVQFPFSNLSGIYSYLPYAASRRRIRLLQKFNVTEWVDFVRTHRPPTVVLPAAGVRMLLDQKVSAEDLRGVRYISMGATALDHATWREFESRYGIPILYAYGATEFAGAATAMTSQLHETYGVTKFGSVGKPCGANEVRIVDPVDVDRVLGASAEGLIQVRIPYLGGEWIQTNDLGVIDEDGFLFIRGRADGVISRGGFKVLPGPIEVVLCEHASVAAACVVGIADRRLGQVPVAAVQLSPSVAETPTESELRDLVRDRLPSPHVPIAIRIIPEMPRTPSFKIDLGAIRALFSDIEKGGG